MQPRKRQKVLLERIIGEYVDSLQRGEPLDRGELISRHPELAADLRRFFANYDTFRWLGGARDDAERQAPLLAAGERLGNYEIVEEIARGGMGIVYRARQTSPRRTVALKVIAAARLASAKDVQRFRLEAEAVAQLEHPNIVPIYEVGEHDGVPYYAMPFYEAGNLAPHVPEFRDHPRRAARLVATIARAVHHAHERGVLHRDLKPSNILLDGRGEPIILDFGLAKRLGAESSFTQTDGIVGTPSYIAPELASGLKQSVTTATDVYGLGVILYELLTGKPPFEAATPVATLLQVLEDDPRRPGSDNPRVDRDLETICLTCLEKDPERRYPGAEALAKDLERYLLGEPILARASGLLERGLRWARRRPVLAVLVAAGALFLSSLAMLGLWHNARLREALNRSKGELYTADISVAQQAWREGKVEVLLEILDRYLPGRAGEDWRTFEWHYLRRRAASQRVKLDHGGTVTAIAYHPDGTLLATAGGTDGRVRLFDTTDGKLVTTLEGHTQTIASLAFSPDGTELASAGWTAGREELGELKLWDLRSPGRPRTLRSHPGGLVAVAYTVDGESLATAGVDSIVRLWDRSSGTLRAQMRGDGGSLRAMAFSPDGRFLASTGAHSVYLWDLGHLEPSSDGVVVIDGVTHRRFPTRWKHTRSVAFSPDGSTLAAASSYLLVYAWDVMTGKLTSSFLARARIAALDWSPRGGMIATAGGHGNGPGELALWSMPGGELTRALTLHPSTIGAMAFSPDGSLLATAAEHEVELLDVSLALEPEFLATGSVECLAFSPRGDVLAAGGSSAASLFEMGAGTPLEPLIGSRQTPNKVVALSFSPDGESLATVDERTGVVLWSLGGERTSRSLRGHRGQVRSLAHSPDGGLLAVGSFKFVAVWKPASAALVAEFEAHESRVYDMAFSPEGRVLASAGGDGKVTLWSVTGWRERRTISSVAGECLAVAFSADGTLLATGWADRTTRLFEVSTGQSRGLLRGHDDSVTGVAFSADGRTLATASRDGSVKLWDFMARQQRLSLEAGAPLRDVAFSPDGKNLAACGRLGVTLWRAATPEPLSLPERSKSGIAAEIVPPARLSADSCRWIDVTPGVLREPDACQGAAWGDHDGDGDADLYLARNGPNRLLRNDGNGEFVESTPTLLADDSNSYGAAWADHDGDGDLDLFVTNRDGPSRLFRNDGGGDFNAVEVEDLGTGGARRGVAWVDYDGDGVLDLQVAHGERGLRLFRGRRGGGFEEVTGRLFDGEVACSAAAWGDYDGDGDPDLYAISNTANWLFRNDGGVKFVDVTSPPLANRRRCRAAAWGDHDGDGDLDLYVVNWGEANKLFRNEGGDRFSDVTTWPLGDWGQGTGAVWGDYDNDGDLDLFLANNDGTSKLLRNDGSDVFADVTHGPLTRLGSAYALAWVDHDGDGDLDLFVSDWDSGNHLLRNDSPTGHHWLHIELEGTASNRAAIGARVRAVVSGSGGARTQMCEITSGPGWGCQSQNDSMAMFGLGPATVVERLEIRWPSGTRQTLHDVAVDRRMRLVEPPIRPSPATSPATVK